MNNSFLIKKTSLFLILIFFLPQFTKVIAQNGLSDSQVKERLQYIRNNLIQDKRSENIWWYGWLMGYSAATIGQSAIYFTSDSKNVKQDMALGAATTFLGTIGQILDPMVSGHACKVLSNISENTPEERRLKLLKAGEFLKQSSIREKRGKSWKVHAVTGAVNLSGGFVVWLEFKRSAGEGLLNFLINSAVTEIQIWSQPTRAVADYNNYINNFKSEPALGYNKPKVRMFVNAFPGGIKLSFAF